MGSFLPGTLSGLWLDIGGGILFIGLFLRRGICGGFGHIYLLCVLEAAAPANRCVPGGRSQLERAPTTRCPPPRVFACRGFRVKVEGVEVVVDTGSSSQAQPEALSSIFHWLLCLGPDLARSDPLVGLPALAATRVPPCLQRPPWE